MIAWRPHTEKPTGPEVALIAVRDPHDGEGSRPFLLAEIYRFAPEFDCWLGESNALRLKHEVFMWARERDILETLP